MSIQRRRTRISGALVMAGLAALTGCQGPEAGEAAAGSRPAASVQAPARDLLPDLIQRAHLAEEKIVGLAQAIPEDQYGWRPAEGVRSVGEVFIHVAADNYFIPALMGVSPPAGSGVTADYATVQAYEARNVPRDQIVAELQASFRFLYDAIDASRSDLDRSFEFAGTTYQVGPMWVQAITHLHEHLGQGIAYARSTGVTPPWSR